MMFRIIVFSTLLVTLFAKYNINFDDPASNLTYTYETPIDFTDGVIKLKLNLDNSYFSSYFRQGNSIIDLVTIRSASDTSRSDLFDYVTIQVMASGDDLDQAHPILMVLISSPVISKDFGASTFCVSTVPYDFSEKLITVEKIGQRFTFNIEGLEQNFGNYYCQDFPIGETGTGKMELSTIVIGPHLKACFSLLSFPGIDLLPADDCGFPVHFMSGDATYFEGTCSNIPDSSVQCPEEPDSREECISEVHAAFNHPTERFAYVISHDQYVRLQPNDRNMPIVSEGYPQNVSEQWPGLEGEVDAAFTDYGSGRTYFLVKSNPRRKVYVWNWKDSEMEREGEDEGNTDFAALPRSEIKGVASYRDHVLFLFGNEFYRWTPETGLIEEPQTWPYLPAGDAKNENKSDDDDVNMTFYSDSRFSRQFESGVDATDQGVFHLGDSKVVYVELTSNNSNTFIVETCFATPNGEVDYPDPYYLLKNGCKKDDSFKIHEGLIPRTRARLSFYRFKFAEDNFSGQVYVHCNVRFCEESDVNCRVNCRSDELDMFEKGSVSQGPYNYGPFTNSEDKRDYSSGAFETFLQGHYHSDSKQKPQRHVTIRSRESNGSTGETVEKFSYRLFEPEEDMSLPMCT